MAENDEPSYIRLLRALGEMRRYVAEVEYEAIQTARAAGATWQDVADELDISRQAARSYFSSPKGRRRGTQRPRPE